MSNALTLLDSKGTVVHEFPNRETCFKLLKQYLNIAVSIDPSMNQVSRDIPPDQVNQIYADRNAIVEYCVVLAKQCGYKAGFAVHQPIYQLMPRVQNIEEMDPVHPDAMRTRKMMVRSEWDVQWGVVAYIELPTGQITWHLDSGDYVWDNHSNDTKRKRVSKFVNMDKEDK